MNRISKLWPVQQPDDYNTLQDSEFNQAPKRQDGINISINNITTKHSRRSFGRIMILIFVTFFSMLLLFTFGVSDALSSLTTSPVFPYITTSNIVPEGRVTSEDELVLIPIDSLYTEELRKSEERKKMTAEPEDGTGCVNDAETVTFVTKTTVSSIKTVFVTITPALHPSPSVSSSTSSSSLLADLHSSTLSSSPSYSSTLEATPTEDSSKETSSGQAPHKVTPTPSSSSISSNPIDNKRSACTTTYIYTAPTHAPPTNLVTTVYASTKTVSSEIDCGSCDNLAISTVTPDMDTPSGSITAATLAELPTWVLEFQCSASSGDESSEEGSLSTTEMATEPTFTTLPTPTFTLTIDW